MSKQITLFDQLEEQTKVNLCECCKQPSKNNIHPECSDLWWDRIVMKQFKKDEETKPL